MEDSTPCDEFLCTHLTGNYSRILSGKGEETPNRMTTGKQDLNHLEIMPDIF